MVGGVNTLVFARYGLRTGLHLQTGRGNVQRISVCMRQQQICISPPSYTIESRVVVQNYPSPVRRACVCQEQDGSGTSRIVVHGNNLYYEHNIYSKL